MEDRFPSWMTVREDGTIQLDPDGFYPAYLKELEIADESIDQYWLEVVYQMVKLDVQALIVGTEYDQNSKGILTQINILSDDGRKSRWVQVNFPFGLGVAQASTGQDARKLYISRRRGHPWLDLLPGERWGSAIDEPTEVVYGPFPVALSTTPVTD